MHLHGDVWVVAEECKTCICSMGTTTCSQPEKNCKYSNSYNKTPDKKISIARRHKNFPGAMSP